jgi:hypothetical protein
MSEFSPQSPWLLPGALIVLNDTSLVPRPSMIPFQYNPSTLSRSLEPYKGKEEIDNGQISGKVVRAQPGPPTETISLTLELDATDYLEDPASHPVGSMVGVASPIASMEKLMYPTGFVISKLIDAISSLLPSLSKEEVPRSEVPIVLFFWGPSRIVPVRVASLTFEEQAHTPLLFPFQVSARLSLLVLTPADFPKGDPKKGVRMRSKAELIAIAAYEWTSLNRDLISAAGLVDTAAGIITD